MPTNPPVPPEGATVETLKQQLEKDIEGLKFEGRCAKTEWGCDEDDNAGDWHFAFANRIEQLLSLVSSLLKAKEQAETKLNHEAYRGDKARLERDTAEARVEALQAERDAWRADAVNDRLARVMVEEKLNAQVADLSARLARQQEGDVNQTGDTNMTVTIGRTVLYTLTAGDAKAINRRRTTGTSIAERMKAYVSPDISGPPRVPSDEPLPPPVEAIRIAAWPAGAQAHIGNTAAEGDIVPLVVVRVWPNEYGEGIPGVNGQAFLDGNDVLWVTSAKEGTEPGTWAWPART